MASGHPQSSTAQQGPLSPNPTSITPGGPYPNVPQPGPIQAASPPTKQNLKSWWRTFKGQPKSAPETHVEPTGIFGVPLRQSITYANVAISLVDAEGKSYIYGYVPIVVAKCGVYLKEKATNVEGIFRLSGAEKRIRELVVIFNSPDRYGKGLDWDGYTVHDAANVLRRYLNQLPEPIVPLDLYDRFREPIDGHAREAVGDQEAEEGKTNFDLDGTIANYQQLITELPPLNRQLLLYILDLLAVFASKSDENRMTSQNLAAIFQPGMLSHPEHDMAPAEYRLSQNVLVFLIENQDNFLIGMRGTAADEKTVHDVQNGSTPPPATPTAKSVARSSSNASAGADSLRRQGGVRRNLSVNSRHSKQSNNAPSPASPAYGTTLTQTSSGGVHRSNTVPSKKSPGLGSNRLQNSTDGRSPSTNLFQPPTPTFASSQNTTSAQNTSGGSSPHLNPTVIGTSSLPPASHAATAGQSQDRLLLDPADKGEPNTPTRDRALFLRSPTTESEKRQPNKLKKKRIPGSANPSAQSSQNSLHVEYPAPVPAPNPAHVPTSQFDIRTPNQMVGAAPDERGNGSNVVGDLSSRVGDGRRVQAGVTTYGYYSGNDSGNAANTSAGNAFGVPATMVAENPSPHSDLSATGSGEYTSTPDEALRASDTTLKPQGSSNSLHSRGGDESMNDASDFDHDPGVAAEQKEKRRRWRLSRKKDESLGANLTSPKKNIGTNGGAEMSTGSFGSGQPRHSFTGDTLPPGSESGMSYTRLETSNDSGPSNGSREDQEKKGPVGWLKTKMAKAKEEKREREAEKEKERALKGQAPTSDSSLPTRGKSMDFQRSESAKDEIAYAPSAS